MRKIIVSKLQGKVDWKIEVEDSYGNTYDLGKYPAHQFVDKNNSDETNIEAQAEKIWSKEKPPSLKEIQKQEIIEYRMKSFRSNLLNELENKEL